MSSGNGSTGKRVLPTHRPLIRVRGLQSHPVIITGNIHSWMMHWDPLDRRTQPCLMNGCVHCSAFNQRRPLSYVACLTYVTRDDGPAWCPAILEVPLTTGYQLDECRRQPIGLKRLRPKGPITIGTFSTRVAPEHMDPFDIVPHLFRLWRLPATAQLRLLTQAEAEMWSVAGD